MSFCKLLCVPALLAIVLVFSPLECNGDQLQNCLNNVAKLEKKNGEHVQLLNVLAGATTATGYINAYLAGECYVAGGKSTTYDGILAQTVDGHTCQRWDSNSPHQHNYHDASKYPDATLADAENYCRDPSASGYTWCYTTNTNVRWQQCGVTQCLAEFDGNRCYHFNETANDYKGFVRQTFSGKTCQRWDSQSPHSHSFTNSSLYPENDISQASNYCRDPQGWGLTWCYTTDPSTRWEVCNTPKCLA